MIQLYPDQVEFLNNLRRAMTDNKSVMGEAFCGFGKTVIGAHIAQRMTQRNRLIYFTVHRKNLIRQTCLTFNEFGIDHGFIASGITYEQGKNVYVASIGTLGKRMESLPVPYLMIVDEAHMGAAKTWEKIIAYYRSKGAYILGLSGSPERHDGKPLSHLFDTMVDGPAVKWLVDNNRLSNYKLFAPSAADMTGVKRSMGEYDKKETDERMERAHIVGDAITSYKKYAPGTRAIGFCISIERSIQTAEQFTANGIPAAHLDGTTKDHIQKKAINALADGEIKVIFNVALMDTGFDLSAQVGREVPIETLIDLQPTLSTPKQIQKWGRALRRKEHPAIILDHAGNSYYRHDGQLKAKHGLPDDERQWNLEGRIKGKRKKKDEEDDLKIKQCPKCFRVHEIAPVCPNCGYVYPVVGRDIPEIEGELEQIDPEAMRAKKREMMKKARTREELEEVAQAYGFKPGWVDFTLDARRRAHEQYKYGRRKRRTA